MIVYGIPNCDTVKKAISWLNKNKIAYEFHDYKKAGITADKIKTWIKQVGIEVVINKKSTTWKTFTTNQQSAIANSEGIALIVKNPTVIKRPLLEEKGKVIIVGFDEEEYVSKLK